MSGFNEMHRSATLNLYDEDYHQEMDERTPLWDPFSRDKSPVVESVVENEYHPGMSIRTLWDSVNADRRSSSADPSHASFWEETPGASSFHGFTALEPGEGEKPGPRVRSPSAPQNTFLSETRGPEFREAMPWTKPKSSLFQRLQPLVPIPSEELEDVSDPPYVNLDTWCWDTEAAPRDPPCEVESAEVPTSAQQIVQELSAMGIQLGLSSVSERPSSAKISEKLLSNEPQPIGAERNKSRVPRHNSMGFSFDSNRSESFTRWLRGGIVAGTVEPPPDVETATDVVDTGKSREALRAEAHLRRDESVTELPPPRTPDQKTRFEHIESRLRVLEDSADGRPVAMSTNTLNALGEKIKADLCSEIPENGNDANITRLETKINKVDNVARSSLAWLLKFLNSEIRSVRADQEDLRDEIESTIARNNTTDATWKVQCENAVKRNSDKLQNQTYTLYEVTRLFMSLMTEEPGNRARRSANSASQADVLIQRLQRDRSLLSDLEQRVANLEDSVRMVLSIVERLSISPSTSKSDAQCAETAGRDPTVEQQPRWGFGRPRNASTPESGEDDTVS